MFCSGESRLRGGTPISGIPCGNGPGTSRLVRPGPSGGCRIVVMDVGSCPRICGDRHGGGKTSGGGLGCGAQEARFSPPTTILMGRMAGAEFCEASVFGPPGIRTASLSPVFAHRLPPPL
jgi:hypothetical protein